MVGMEDATLVNEHFDKYMYKLKDDGVDLNYNSFHFTPST